MIEGIGVDIVEVAGVESAILNYGESYLQRLFTAREIEYCRTSANSAQRYAARIAAKEAVMKAMRVFPSVLIPPAPRAGLHRTSQGAMGPVVKRGSLFSITA
jgi:phosphopantetheine--protein transferase-like protein